MNIPTILNITDKQVSINFGDYFFENKIVKYSCMH